MCRAVARVTARVAASPPGRSPGRLESRLPSLFCSSIRSRSSVRKWVWARGYCRAPATRKVISFPACALPLGNVPKCVVEHPRRPRWADVRPLGPGTHFGTSCSCSRVRCVRLHIPAPRRRLNVRTWNTRRAATPEPAPSRGTGSSSSRSSWRTPVAAGIRPSGGSAMAGWRVGASGAVRPRSSAGPRPQDGTRKGGA